MKTILLALFALGALFGVVPDAKALTSWDVMVHDRTPYNTPITVLYSNCTIVRDTMSTSGSSPLGFFLAGCQYSNEVSVPPAITDWNHSPMYQMVQLRLDKYYGCAFTNKDYLLTGGDEGVLVFDCAEPGNIPTEPCPNPDLPPKEGEAK